LSFLIRSPSSPPKADIDACYGKPALPGIDEKNVDVKVVNGVLTIKGERQEDKEEKKKDY
jgi:HSP20 family protein